MNRSEQQTKALALRHRHRAPPLLVLPNAWDAVSARLFEQAGFPAVATTSAGIAAVLGYPDGQRISRDQMLAMVGRIVAAVSVPVSADMEAGFGQTVEQIAATAKALVEIGAVGMNLEDSTGHADKPLIDVAFQVEAIQAVRAVADGMNVPLVLNARTDVFLHPLRKTAVCLKEAVQRANAYHEAGADCLFLIGVRERDTIAQLVREIRGPVNLLAGPGAPNLAELEQLGVTRVTFGSGLMRATLPLVRRMAQELRTSGTYNSFTQSEFLHATVNQLFER